MSERYHRGFSAAEKTELWDRWQRGESRKRLDKRLASRRRLYISSWHRTGEFVLRHGAARGWR